MCRLDYFLIVVT